MARLYRVNGFILDDFWDADRKNIINKDISEMVEDNLCIPLHINVDASTEFEIEVKDKLLNKNCDIWHLEAYFKKRSEQKYDRAIPKSGETWKSIKDGKEVGILAIAENSEAPGTYSVVYVCGGGRVFNLPLGQFMEELDQNKYRFEKVE